MSNTISNKLQAFFLSKKEKLIHKVFYNSLSLIQIQNSLKNLLIIPYCKKQCFFFFFFLVNEKWELAKLRQPPSRALRLRPAGQPLWMPTNERLLATGLKPRWVKWSAQTLPTEPFSVGAKKIKIKTIHFLCTIVVPLQWIFFEKKCECLQNSFYPNNTSYAE